MAEKKVELVALRGFVGEDADEKTGQKVDHAPGDVVKVSKPFADELLHYGKAALPDAPAAKLAVAQAKEAAKPAAKK